MKQKTKQTLRTLAIPFLCLWVVVSAVLVSIGSIVKMLGLLMVDPGEARNELTETFDNNR